LVAAEAEKALLRTIATETASFVLLNILYLHGRASRPGAEARAYAHAAQREFGFKKEPRN
jgi:hypothetical protein